MSGDSFGYPNLGQALDINAPLSLEEILTEVFGDDPLPALAELMEDIPLPFPPAIVIVNGQNVLINDHGDTLLDTLRRHAPRWYQVAAEAYIAMYSWHGTTDARPMLQTLAQLLIDKAIESFTAIDPTWNLEHVSIPTLNGTWQMTSLDNPRFISDLKKTISAAGVVFYNRTVEVVRYLMLPSHPQHPGIIRSERATTTDEWMYVNDLATWNARTGYTLWHDFRADENGVVRLHWFDRLSLKYLMNMAHLGVGTPGYMYIQELYVNVLTGGEEWGPLVAATFHSTTWILAAVYLSADVLHNRRLAPGFNQKRRDAVLEIQYKISILLRQILRKGVPGLGPEQSELAYVGLHSFMRTNPNLPFLI